MKRLLKWKCANQIVGVEGMRALIVMMDDDKEEYAQQTGIYFVLHHTSVLDKEPDCELG